MPPEYDKNLADVWETVGEAAIKCGVSIGEVAEAVRVLSRNSVSAARAGENLRRELQRITEQEQEENHLEMFGKGIGDWRCSHCHRWNPRSRDCCFWCNRTSKTQKGDKIRVIRFLKKLKALEG